MTVHTFYRCAVWLPLLAPAALAYAVHVLGWHPIFRPVVKLVQLLIISVVYGGVPYVVLAGYASWWIDHRPEPAILRRPLRAPLWMIALWVPVAAWMGVHLRSLNAFAGLLGLGVLFIILLGYTYVALVLLMRTLMTRFGWLRPG